MYVNAAYYYAQCLQVQLLAVLALLCSVMNSTGGSGLQQMDEQIKGKAH